MELRGRGQFLSTPCMHFKVGVLFQPVDFNILLSRPGLFKSFSLLGTTILTRLPHRCDQGLEVICRGPFPKRFPEVNAILGIQAQIPEPIGREAASVTGCAERSGGGRDNPKGRAIG